MASIVGTGRNIIELYQGFLFQRYSNNSTGKKWSYMMTEAMIRTCPKCGNRSVDFLYIVSTVKVERNDIELYTKIDTKIQ
jgi:hypothetical protein